MKLTIKKDILLENLNYVSKAISTKNIIPILSGIKFELTGEGLFLTASDNELTIQAFINKKDIKNISETGSIVIQGKYILEIIRKLPSEYLDIEILDGLKIAITTDSSSYNLNGMSATEFINFNLEMTKDPIVVSNKIFKSIINQTSFAISTQESRPILTGINIKIKDNILEATATDSYRLAKKIINLNSSYDDFNVVIPGRNLLELVKILDENDIEIHIFNSKVLFKFSNILFETKILSGTYPDTSKLIPEDYLINVTSNLSNIYNAIDRVSILASEKEKNIIKFELNKKEAIISSNSLEIGRAEEKINITKDNEEEIKISFSSKYMLDALRVIESNDVNLYFYGDVKPIIIKQPSDESLILLVLPIKTY